MYYTENIVESIVKNEHCWTVAEQFTSTWYDRSEENFSDQNSNALKGILGTVKGLLKSDSFSPDSINEIESYKESLEEYLSL
jgi:hypothetical protein